MKRLNDLLIFIFVFLAASCSKENNLLTEVVDENGTYISMPYQWKKQLHYSGQFHSNSYFIMPIYYNSYIAIPTTDEEGERCMTMINTINANDKWSIRISNSYVFGVFIHDNILLWQNGRTSYALNMQNGEMLWEQLRNYDVIPNHYNKYSDSFIMHGVIRGDQGYDEEVAFIGDAENGEVQEFLRANLSGEYAAPVTNAGLIGGISYINQIDDTSLISVVYSEPLPDWKVKMLLGLYDVENGDWIYENIPITEPHWNAGVQHNPIIFNNKIYMASGKSIVCHDIMTGEEVWRRDFQQDFLFSGFIIEDGKLIANCEDLRIYRINPDNGNVMWVTSSAGTSGRMSYMNGIVYYVGGSTGRLHAVDTATGKIVWLLDASLIESSSSSFRTNAVYVIPGEGGEKGRVIAITHKYAYSFEAYQ